MELMRTTYSSGGGYLVFRVTKEKCISLSVALLITGCTSPGYLIRIKAESVHTSAIDELKNEVKKRSFSTEWDGKEVEQTGDIVYTYRKDFNGELDYINVSISHHKNTLPGDWIELDVSIENRHIGRKAPIKQHIEELGDSFYKIISEKTVEGSEVTLKRAEVGYTFGVPH